MEIWEKLLKVIAILTAIYIGFMLLCCPAMIIALPIIIIRLAIPLGIIYIIFLTIKRLKADETTPTENIHSELNKIEKSMLQQEKIDRITTELDEIEESLNDRIQREASTDKVTWIWDDSQGKP